ncbi:transcriptional regulator [Sphaerisporangium siamense]|uniref:DNA-binding HxlR family transcriptional regulator n=1 Tax=Sphaerisporangium siamense TaxID=795645 RepID=A0A7W7DBR9_9ACTN|nr:helix-turn-helix domain-containing protein [Sphaerisporangium siamense]MBB4703681.1 DNA-binding HxlR family transcriptional regulator [Sphaerisporangium siamense]GII82153.1 transcriptional regulator [Sphaerisporangium siamense]
MSRQPYACGLDAAVDVMGGKWKARILWRLSEGTRRFEELRREIPGISEKMLIQQLREMEAHGLVHREIHRQVPPKVEYSLTEFGVSLNAALEPLGDWGHVHMERIVAAQEALEQERARPRGARP